MTPSAQATTLHSVKASKARPAPWLSLFLDGPAAGQFSTDIGRAQKECRRVVWIHKTAKFLRICPPPNDADEYVTRIYSVVDVDARRQIIRWQLVPDRNDEPLRLITAFRAGSRNRL